MLFMVRDKQLMVNAKSDSFDTIYQIGEAVNGIEAAKTGNSIMKARVDEF